MRKILVCGSTSFSDYDLFEDTLDQLHANKKITHIVHGNAPGADKLSFKWGYSNAIKVLTYRADTSVDEETRFFDLNEKMLDRNPDIELVVNFAGGPVSTDLTTKARSKGIEVLNVT